jgi:hypothetical protein
MIIFFIIELNKESNINNKNQKKEKIRKKEGKSFIDNSMKSKGCN